MKNRFAHLLSMVVLVGSVLFVFSTAMAATVIIVTTTADTIADDGQCSLREAVIAANTDSPVGGCPAGSGADTITFASSLPQPATFQLTLTGAGEDNAATGDLDVIGQLTITGQGTAQTILDGNGTDRVLDIQPGANLSLSSLTVRNGTSINGGGISSVGRLTLKDVTLQSNNGDGLLNNGGLATLTNVTVKDNLGGYGILNQGQGSLTFTGGEVSGNQNGGIYNTVATAILTNIKVLNNSGAGGVANVGTATSRLSMTGCVVSNNTSTTSGGGIKSDGAQNIVDIHDTTISSNLATAAGGGIFNIGTMSVSGSTIDHNSSRSGAGIDHFGGVLSLMNDTISANTASDNGGGLYNRGNATLTNVTFSTNRANGAGTGGNIFIDTASLTLKNTIVSGSEADGNCVNNGGTIISLGHNLESANSCSFTVTSDLPNTAPLLGALQDNGGPTFTQALQAGSPAIDRGDNNGCPTTDQRGFSRPVDGDANGSAVCDIGSFELNGVSPSPTFTPTPTSTQTATPTPTGTLTNTPTSTPTPTPTSTGVPTPNPVSISKASGIGAINLDGQNLNPWSNKAFFQFQIRYRSGDIAPTGHIFYLDPKAHFFLVSKSFDQLVINGSSAKFTGLATVNGSKNVSFEVNVIDYGDRQGDDTLWKNHDPMDEFRIGIPSLDNYLVGGTLAEGNITIRVKNRNADTTGVFRPGNGAIFLKNANTTGFADVAINYGLPGDYPVVGDWDGNGTATIGVYRNGVFFLRNSNTNGFAEIVFAFGTPGDQPVAGDWNGDGIDSVGVYRSSTGEFLLRDSNSAGAPDASFSLGNPGDIGLAGDWDGDGIDTTGVFRPSNGVIFLKNSNSTGFADIELNYGMSGDRPVTGDWNADGVDTIGIYRNGVFYLRNSNTIGFADLVFGLGIPGDIPIAGDWDGLP